MSSQATQGNMYQFIRLRLANQYQRMKADDPYLSCEYSTLENTWDARG